MSVDDFYKIVLHILNKNQQGYLKPADFNRDATLASKQYVSWLLGSFQQYTYGRAIAKVELGQNAIVRQRLAPTIKRATLTIDGSGNSNYPTGFIQSDAMYDSTGFNKIRLVQQDSLDSVYNSVIDPIATNPIYLIEDTRFQFYPVTTATAKLSYVQTPPNIVWGYTLDGNGRPVYDAGTSVDPIFDDIAMLDIISRVLKIEGVTLQEGAVLQYANELKNLGQ